MDSSRVPVRNYMELNDRIDDHHTRSLKLIGERCQLERRLAKTEADSNEKRILEAQIAEITHLVGIERQADSHYKALRELREESVRLDEVASAYLTQAEIDDHDEKLDKFRHQEVNKRSEKIFADEESNTEVTTAARTRLADLEKDIRERRDKRTENVEKLTPRDKLIAQAGEALWNLRRYEVQGNKEANESWKANRSKLLENARSAFLKKIAETPYRHIYKDGKGPKGETFKEETARKLRQISEEAGGDVSQVTAQLENLSHRE